MLLEVGRGLLDNVFESSPNLLQVIGKCNHRPPGLLPEILLLCTDAVLRNRLDCFYERIGLASDGLLKCPKCIINLNGQGSILL